MISLNQVREALIIEVQSFQAAEYPGMKVNYPNRVTVDIENQQEPFISVEIDFSKVKRASVDSGGILVPGKLNLYFYFREGTGTSASLSYVDKVMGSFAMKASGPLAFGVPKTFPVTSFPGWKGLLISAPFDVAAV